jgi:hypothetical protein
MGGGRVITVLQNFRTLNKHHLLPVVKSGILQYNSGQALAFYPGSPINDIICRIGKR